MNTNLVVMTDAVVTRGQRAWTRIKATAEEQRELWRQVGEALNVGRKMHKADQKFSQWCKDNGFGDMDRHDRADSMWLAQVWCEVCDGHTPGDLSHPSRIRRWFNDQPKEPLPADLQDATIEVKTIPSVDQKTAEKVAKLANRAKAGDEGSEIAQRHLDSLAKKHGVSTEDLKEVSSTKAPAAFYQFTPEQVGMLDELKQNVLETIKELELAGLNKTAIAAVFLNVAAMIKEQ